MPDIGSLASSAASLHGHLGTRMNVLRFSSALLMMLVVNTYARSFTPADVPDPPQRRSFRFLPPAARGHFLARDRTPKRSFRQSNSKVMLDTRASSSVKVPPIAVVNTPVQSRSRTKDKILPQHAQIQTIPKAVPHGLHFRANSKASSHNKTKPKIPIIVPAHLKEKIIFAHHNDSIKAKNDTVEEQTTTAKPQNITTTLDPWDEFCELACEEGMAGPECDCAEHPIGRRHAPLSEPNFQNHPNSFVVKTDFKQIPHPVPATNLNIPRPHPVRPIPPNPSYPPTIIPDVRPADGSDGNEEEIKSTTTKDPLEEFCDVACKEGQGSVACDCPDHIIG